MSSPAMPSPATTPPASCADRCRRRRAASTALAVPIGLKVGPRARGAQLCPSGAAPAIHVSQICDRSTLDVGGCAFDRSHSAGARIAHPTRPRSHVPGRRRRNHAHPPPTSAARRTPAPPPGPIPHRRGPGRCRPGRRVAGIDADRPLGAERGGPGYLRPGRGNDAVGAGRSGCAPGFVWHQHASGSLAGMRSGLGDHRTQLWVTLKRPSRPVGFQNWAMTSDQRFRAASSCWLIRPPRTGRRRILL